MSSNRITGVFLSHVLLLLAIATLVQLPALAQPQPSQSEVLPDVQAFRAAQRMADPKMRIEALEKFLIDYPQSRYVAMVPNLILDLLIKGGAEQKDKIVAQANKMIDAAPENNKSSVYHNISSKLLQAEILIDVAEGFAAKAVSSLKEGKYLETQRQTYLNRNAPPPPDDVLLKGFDRTRATYLANLGQIYLKQEKDTEAEKVFKEAQKLNPSLGTALGGLAKLALKAGKVDKALDLMTDAALSGRMTPDARKVLEEVYSKTHQGSLAGLEEMLDGKYLKTSSNPLHVKPYKPKSSRTDRVVLAEVFTGSACSPCVAADLAFDAVLERYQRKEVAVIMYHLHIPQPDPMTNPSTQSRASFYGVRGVPTYRIDGKAGGGGGARDYTPRIYDRFNPLIEKQLETPSQAEIKLDTALEDGMVKVKATVTGIHNQSSSLKLQIALVENKLRYSGQNGIRFHPMVVRSLAGPKGGGFRVSASQPTTVEHTFDLAQITNEIKAHLDAHEQRNTDFKFNEKKHMIDAGNLSVVAFVQDEADLQILQSSFVELRSRAASSTNEVKK